MGPQNNDWTHHRPHGKGLFFWMHLSDFVLTSLKGSVENILLNRLFQVCDTNPQIWNALPASVFPSYDLL